VDPLPDAKRSDAVDFEPTNLTRGGLFKDAGAGRFPNAQVLDEDGLVTRALSSSYAPREEGSRDAFAEAMRELFRTFVREGHVTLQYTTLVYLAQRKR
jgi:hypothetical protein